MNADQTNPNSANRRQQLDLLKSGSISSQTSSGLTSGEEELKYDSQNRQAALNGYKFPTKAKAKREGSVEN